MISPVGLAIRPTMRSISEDCHQSERFHFGRVRAGDSLKEYRHRAEECLRLANETKEIFAKVTLLEMVAEFRAMAQQLELRERRSRQRRFSPAAIEKFAVRH